MSNPRAVALYSGGLDSTLAIRVMQEQGVTVEAVNIRTTFRCCKSPAAQLAAELGVRLTVLSVADEYVNLIRKPSYGYGKGMNPCVDCRIYMATMARKFMQEVGACVVITGEILGQRPMSQKRCDLAIIERQSGLSGRLLRPLCAKLLPPTIPERDGLVDRERLYAFHGRGRKPLVNLARQLGIRRIPPPSTGCSLTEITFAPRVRDLIECQPDAGRADFELLSVGRHFRFDRQTKIVVGRNEEENAWIELYFARENRDDMILVRPENFVGPVGLVRGLRVHEASRWAGAVLLQYTRQADPANAAVRVLQVNQPEQVFQVQPLAFDETVETL
ncbi:MAG: hypothetical protein GXY83_44295 [Rhodopirellula sp.]|nr:hypothetical protein [Rhodopirellula sp.]